MRKPYQVLKAESEQRAREWCKQNTERREFNRLIWNKFSTVRRVVREKPLPQR